MSTPREPRRSPEKPQRRRLPPCERRAQIVQAVKRVVAEHGVEAATVARIAAAAGVSEGTLYVYFAGREEMMTAALDSLFEQMAHLIDSAPQAPAGAALRAIAGRHSQVMKTEREGFTIPWIEFIAGGNHLGLRDAIASTQSRAFAKILAIIERGQAEGAVRPDLDARRITWQFYSVMWAENLSSLMGLAEYIDSGHSSYSLDLLLRDALVSPSAVGACRGSLEPASQVGEAGKHDEPEQEERQANAD